MARRNKQAMKRHRQSLKRRARNKYYKSTMRTFVKRVRAAAAAGDAKASREALARALPIIDRVAGKGIIHKNTAARLKSRLTRLVAKVEQRAA